RWRRAHPAARQWSRSWPGRTTPPRRRATATGSTRTADRTAAAAARTGSAAAAPAVAGPEVAGPEADRTAVAGLGTARVAADVLPRHSACSDRCSASGSALLVWRVAWQPSGEAGVGDAGRTPILR